MVIQMQHVELTNGELSEQKGLELMNLGFVLWTSMTFWEFLKKRVVFSEIVEICVIS